jgi:hypothetical protein
MPARAVLAASTALSLALLLTGCSSGSTPQASAGGSSAGCPITATDTWVKAAKSGMTAAFGTLENTGSADVTIVSAESRAAGRMEIHEVVDKDGAPVMRPKEGGLEVPAGGTAALKPGADHLMLMAIPAPIEAGDTVEITLNCDDGSTAEFSGIAKPFEGAAETYEPGGMSGSASSEAGMSGSASSAESGS